MKPFASPVLVLTNFRQKMIAKGFRPYGIYVGGIVRTSQATCRVTITS